MFNDLGECDALHSQYAVERDVVREVSREPIDLVHEDHAHTFGSVPPHFDYRSDHY